MSTAEMIRAWKDEDYRLDAYAGAAIAHPAGDPVGEVYVSDVSQSNSCETASCHHMCSC